VNSAFGVGRSYGFCGTGIRAFTGAGPIGPCLSGGLHIDQHCDGTASIDVECPDGIRWRAAGVRVRCSCREEPRASGGTRLRAVGYPPACGYARVVPGGR